MKAKAAVILLTIYLIAYAFTTSFFLRLSFYMFLMSPFLIVWSVYTVLKDDQNKYPELGEDEEWGYRDITKDQLGMF